MTFNPPGCKKFAEILGNRVMYAYVHYDNGFSIHQAAYSSDLPCETVSKIHLVDLAGRLVIMF